MKPDPRTMSTPGEGAGESSVTRADRYTINAAHLYQFHSRDRRNIGVFHVDGHGVRTSGPVSAVLPQGNSPPRRGQGRNVSFDMHRAVVHLRFRVGCAHRGCSPES
jgi:hypothetical protein